MATKVEWTDRAITNLNNIYDFIALDSETYANRFVKALIKSTEKQLSVFPYSGRYIPEFENTPLCFLKEVLFKGYRIIYNPDQVLKKLI